jgi:hypothetical protein
MQSERVVEKGKEEGVVVAQIEPQFLAWLTRELAKRYEVEVNVSVSGKTKWVKVPRK